MSQPPQSGWGQPPSGDPYGQRSANGGYGAAGQSSPGYGAPSPAPGQSTYGQDGTFAPAFGDSTGPQGGPGGPKKSLKVPLLVCGGCLLLVLLLVVVGGGIYLFTRDSGETAGGGGGETTSAEEQTEEATDEGDGEPSDEPAEDPTDEPTEEQSEEPSDEPTSEPADEPAGEGSGTEDDPYAIGQTFTIEDGEGGTLDVTVGEVDWDATDAVMEESSSNTEVSENQTYILVPVTVTYHGDGTAEPLLLLIMEYHSDAGGVYSDDGALTPQSRVYVDTLSDGDSATWDYGIIVPKDEVEAGRFAVSALFDFAADSTWVAAT